MKRSHRMRLALAVLVFAAASTLVHAGDLVWSEWEPISNEVSVSFAETSLPVNPWTCRFRNDGTTKITYMKFEYWDTFSGGWKRDWLGFDLEPGASRGGPLHFNMRNRTDIRIVEITRQ